MDDTESILSRRWVRFALIWGVWTIVTLFYTSQVYIANSASSEPRKFGYGRELLGQASAGYLWALVTPLSGCHAGIVCNAIIGCAAGHCTLSLV